MKTEKQIKLLELEIGQKLYEASQDFDKIRIKHSEQYDWNDIDKLKDKEKEDYIFNGIPLLKTGVFQIECDDLDDTNIIPVYNLIYNSEIDEENVNVKIQAFADVKDEHIWLFNSPVSYHKNIEIDDDSEILLDGYSDATVEIYQKQNHRTETIMKYIDSQQGTLSEMIGIFVRTMAHINFLMENPEYKDIERKPRKNKNNSNSMNKKNNSNNLQKTNTTKNIVLNGIKIRTNSNSVATKVRSRKVQRVVSCWNVRGHYRHYKSGKVVYINSYEKGKDRNKDNIKHNIKTYTVDK